MSFTNLSTAHLEKLVVFAKKRDSLLAELASVEQQLAAAMGGMATPEPKAPQPRKVRSKGKSKAVKAAPEPAEKDAAVVKSPVVVSAAKAVKAAKTGGRGKRGALKETVLAALQAAGSAGLAVKDLSTKLGVKNQNLHVWFSTTGKSVKGLKKTKTGAWAYSA